MASKKDYLKLRSKCNNCYNNLYQLAYYDNAGRKHTNFKYCKSCDVIFRFVAIKETVINSLK